MLTTTETPAQKRLAASTARRRRLVAELWRVRHANAKAAGILRRSLAMCRNQESQYAKIVAAERATAHLPG